MSARRVALGVAAAVVLAVGIHQLREATQSTHCATGPHTRLRVVLTSSTRESEPTQTIDEITQAHASFCRLEVTSDIEHFRPLGGTDPRRYEVVLRPALDSSDRKQYEGCLEDWNLDQNQIEVLSMDDVPAGSR